MSAFALAGQSVGLQRLTRRWSAATVLAAVWLCAAAVLYVFLAPSWAGNSVMTLVFLGCAGAASLGGMAAYAAAIARQRNLGIVEVITSLRAPIVYCCTIAGLTGAHSVLDALALGGAVIAAALVAPTRGGREGVTEERASHTWVVWSLLASVMFAGIVVSTRLAERHGASVSATTVATLGVAGLGFAGTALVGAHKRVRRQHIRRGEAGLFLLTVLCAAVGNFALYQSVKGSPNPAFPAVLANLRMVVLYAIAIASRADRITVVAITGVILMTVSAALLS